STDPSFPANPVVIGFAVGAALWPNSRRLGAAVCVGGFLIGFARVYVGVFYPTDVFGGAVVGILGALLLHRARRILEPVPSLFVRLARVFVVG
ncbi:MAG: phosphatase PAP2 family protein, partial [Chloroflexota bacterium]